MGAKSVAVLDRFGDREGGDTSGGVSSVASVQKRCVIGRRDDGCLRLGVSGGKSAGNPCDGLPLICERKKNE
jgi:hypothetical protein